MRKYWALLLFSFAFSACDDGNIVYESLNFKNSTIAKCDFNELYYKLNKHEILIMDLSGPNNLPLLNDNIPLGVLDSIVTSDANKIIYRSYSGDISGQTICSTLPPANPKVTKEYTSNSGAYIKYIRNIEVKRFDENIPNKFQIIYSYTFLFENLILSNQNENIKYPSYNFGTYQPKKINSNEADISLIEFSFGAIDACSQNNVLFSKGTNKILQIQLEKPLTKNPGIQTVALNNNQFILYKQKNSNLGTVKDCDTQEVAGFKEVWKTTSGQLTIDLKPANENGKQGLKYTFTLENATFTRTDKQFTVTNLKLGEYFIAF